MPGNGLVYCETRPLVNCKIETRPRRDFWSHFEADTKVQSDYVQTLPSVLMPNASSAGLRLSFVLPVFRSQLQVTSEHRDICELSLLSSSFKQENFPILNFYQLYGMVRNTRLVVSFLNFICGIIWFVQQLLRINNVCFGYTSFALCIIEKPVLLGRSM